MQVVLQQLLLHDAWAAARREARSVRSALRPRGQVGALVGALPHGSWWRRWLTGGGGGGTGGGGQAALPGGHGTWDLAACASSFSLPQQGACSQPLPVTRGFSVSEVSP